MAHHSLGVSPLRLARCRTHGTRPRGARVPHDISTALCSEELLPEHKRNQSALAQAQGFKNSQSPGHAASETVPRRSEKRGQGGTPPILPTQSAKTRRAAATAFGRNISMCARSAERSLSAQELCVGTRRSITQESGSFPMVPNLILKSTLRPGRQNV